MPVLSFIATRAVVAALLTASSLGIAVLLGAPQPPTNSAPLAWIWLAWLVLCLTIPEPPAKAK